MHEGLQISCISEIIFAVWNTTLAVRRVYWPSNDPKKLCVRTSYPVFHSFRT